MGTRDRVRRLPFGGKGEMVVTRSLDQKIAPPAAGKKTSKADFDRNRDGLYGGLPKTRDPGAPGPQPNVPHPQPDESARDRSRARSAK
jgi:hypothetical protein